MLFFHPPAAPYEPGRQGRSIITERPDAPVLDVRSMTSAERSKKRKIREKVWGYLLA